MKSAKKTLSMAHSETEGQLQTYASMQSKHVNKCYLYSLALSGGQYMPCKLIGTHTNSLIGVGLRAFVQSVQPQRQITGQDLQGHPKGQPVGPPPEPEGKLDGVSHL